MRGYYNHYTMLSLFDFLFTIFNTSKLKIFYFLSKFNQNILDRMFINDRTQLLTVPVLYKRPIVKQALLFLLL